MIRNSGAFHSREGLFASVMHRLESRAEAPWEWLDWCEKAVLPITGFPFGLAPGTEARLSFGLVTGEGRQFRGNLLKAGWISGHTWCGIYPNIRKTKE